MRIAALLLVPVLLVGGLAGPASATSETHGGHYIADNSPFIIWCSSESSAPWLPEIPDPNWLVPHPSDFLQAEPYCAPTDIVNDLREAQGEERTEWAYGGFPWALPPASLGTYVTVTPVDELDGPPPLLLVAPSESGDDATAEGCGPQNVQIPLDAERHWRSRVDDPRHGLYAFVSNVMVQEDLTICLGSTGWIEAAYQA